MKEHRLKCGFCKRIIKLEDPRPQPCSACGHGTLREQHPRTQCDNCGEPIYENVDPKRKVICANCTMVRIEEIQRKEKQIGQGFRKTEDMKTKEAMWKVRKESDGEKLRISRLQKGWTSRQTAAYLGISQTYVVLMEQNRKPLINKALQFIAISARPTGEGTHFGNHQPIDNKEVTDRKKRGQ